MKRKVILILISSLIAAVPVLAQVSSTYDLSWHVIGSGGGKMMSAGYALQGTIGQVATGSMRSPNHALCSGFLCSAEAEYRVYLPLLLK